MISPSLLLICLTLYDGQKLEAMHREPVALVLTQDGQNLWVANRKSGTITLVDTIKRAVVFETQLGKSLADLRGLPDGRHLISIDRINHQLLLLKPTRTRVEVSQRLDLPSDPCKIAVFTDRSGTHVAVTSKWSNRVTLLDVNSLYSDTTTLSHKHSLRLPFSPRFVSALNDQGMLIVGDAFGGKLAVIDGTAGSMVSFRSIPAHNIGGICVDSKNNRVIISHQHLNHRSETTADSIHWGFLLTNSLRTIRMKDLLDPTADLGASSHLAHLGEPGTGGGDPFEPVVLANDEVMTALGGVGQVAIGPSDDPDRKRFAAGTKPTAIVLSPDKKFAYVANSLDDTLSVITVASGEVHSISLGPRPADNEIDLGERLFYDAKLSHEGWMSCQSCHGEGHTNGRLADTFGDGSFGAPKEVLSLLGVRDTAPYSWNGGIADLETQVRKSIKTTMRKDQSTDQQVRALTAFLRTLDAPPLVSSKDLDQSALKRGEVIFFERKCDRCHKPPTFTSPKAYDVNLKDEVGNSAYNPPSLRGVGRRSPYFHDGRARRLEDVFTRYGHPLDSVFTDQEAADLVIFLRSL